MFEETVKREWRRGQKIFKVVDTKIKEVVKILSNLIERTSDINDLPIDGAPYKYDDISKYQKSRKT